MVRYLPASKFQIDVLGIIGHAWYLAVFWSPIQYCYQTFARRGMRTITLRRFCDAARYLLKEWVPIASATASSLIKLTLIRKSILVYLTPLIISKPLSMIYIRLRRGVKCIATGLTFAPLTTVMLSFEGTHSIPTTTNTTVLAAKLFC